MADLMRTGRTLGRTLYLVTPGDDRLADKCIGIVDTPELAEWIVASVNAGAVEPAPVTGNALRQ